MLSKNQIFAALLLPIAALLSNQLAWSQPLSIQDTLAITDEVDDYELNGEGVLIAIIDEGIDYKLDDFRHPDGTSRIEYYLDLENNSGASSPSNPIGKGTVYSRAEIDAALAGGSNLPIGEAYGSSTSIAGIAAGSPGNEADQMFEGLAPNSSLIVVKALSLGIPGDDSNSFDSPNILQNAIDFVILKSIELGKPTVVFINSRRLGGPTDGTSLTNKLIDQYSGEDRSSIIFVTSTGDTETIANHASGTISPNGDLTLHIDKNQENVSLIDLWYTATDSTGELQPTITVSVKDPANNTHGPYMPPNLNEFISDATVPGVLSVFYRGGTTNFYQATGSKREVLIRLFGSTGRYTVTLSLDASATEAIPFNATINSNTRTGSNPSSFASLPGEGTVADVAASENIVVVNGYALGTTWTDIDDVARSDNSANGVTGELLTNANKGKTFDGRDVVDFAAPAGGLFGPFPSDSFLATRNARLVKEGLGKYGVVQENQAAAAVTTGLIALMLQLDPKLTAAEAKEILTSTAIKDEATGQTPEAYWGAGKLDASAAIYKTALLSQSKRSPKLSGFTIETGQRQVTIPTLKNFFYILQHRESLTAGDWSNVGDEIAGDGSEKAFSLPTEFTSNPPLGFFRIKVR